MGVMGGLGIRSWVFCHNLNFGAGKTHAIIAMGLVWSELEEMFY